MQPLTAEWVTKAESDFAVMEREGRVRKNPSYDGICFHAQQCAEKYLKAILSEYGFEPGRSHDLVQLLERLLPAHPLWEMFRVDLA
jgi:HEPN domain-containing protein